MGEIKDLSGKTLVAERPEHKREHDPERVNQMRNMLSAALAKMKQGWAQDMAQDPHGATRPDADAVRTHWARKWMEQAVAVMNGTDPVDADPEALDRWIVEQLEGRAHKEHMERPLHALGGLAPFGFAPVGRHQGAELWASTEAALLLVPGGLAEVFVRGQHQGVLAFINLLDQRLLHSHGDVSVPDYTMGELFGLLHAMRRQKPAPPPEDLLNQLRANLKRMQPATP